MPRPAVVVALPPGESVYVCAELVEAGFDVIEVMDPPDLKRALDSRRDIALLNLTYMVNPATDVRFDLRNTDRKGYNLMSFGFGTSPGLIPALEMNVPTDDRTTDIQGRVEFANDRGLLALGYLGSWFENHRPTVTFDNPMRSTDISGGASVGLAPITTITSACCTDTNSCVPADSPSVCFRP